MLNSQISHQWTNLILCKHSNWVNFYQSKKQKKESVVTFIFDLLVKSWNSKRGLLHYQLHCSCFILFPSVHTPSHSFHLPQSILFMFTLFGCIHITWSFNLIVSFTFQPIPSLEINDLRVSLVKFLILNRYSLLEADLRCFYYSLSLYIKQEIQQLESSRWYNRASGSAC